MLGRLKEKPDITLNTPLAEVRERGLKSATTGFGISRAGRGSNLKSLQASEQERPDVTRQLERWQRHQRKLDPGGLAFTDEA